MAESDRQWFIEAAFTVCGAGSKFLFGDTLEACYSSTNVFVDKVARAFNVRGKVAARRVPKSLSKHMLRQQCVFFQNKSNPKECHSVANTLGDSKKKRATLGVTGWLRQAIDCQIRSYRQKRKIQARLSGVDYKPYKCDLCNKTCRKKENHVDHGTGEQSFREIANAFETEVVQRPLTPPDLTDDLRLKWQKFHRNHANLSLTCALCNLTNK